MSIPVATMLLLCPVHGSAAPHPRSTPPDSSILTIAGEREPGVRMVITGRVFDSEGKRPRPAIRVGVYQTDVTGDYGPDNLRGHARLSGWLVTDAQGRYEVRTIRPGAYPGGFTPMHIHFIVDGWGDYELRFEGDPLLHGVRASRREGTFGTIQPVRKDREGVQHVIRDFKSHARAGR
jgi:protocatechuate 3,4-dioxygenase beta subunit